MTPQRVERSRFLGVHEERLRHRGTGAGTERCIERVDRRARMLDPETTSSFRCVIASRLEG